MVAPLVLYAAPEFLILKPLLNKSWVGALASAAEVSGSK